MGCQRRGLLSLAFASALKERKTKIWRAGCRGRTGHFKQPFKQKETSKRKPHLSPVFAKIIINRFRLINNYKRL